MVRAYARLQLGQCPGVIDRGACSCCMCSVRVYSVGGEIPTAPLAWCLDLNRKASRTAKQHLTLLHCAWLLCRDFGLELWNLKRKHPGRITANECRASSQAAGPLVQEGPCN